MSAFVACCSILASAAPAAGTHMATFNEYAQQEPQGASRQDTLRVYQLLGIVVTVPRTDITLRENPAATTVVDSTVLDATPRSIAADEALRLVPGVKVDNQANGFGSGDRSSRPAEAAGRRTRGRLEFQG